MIVTIDGPAGTGKTTIARLIAEKLGFAYFDTGAMYRAVTYLVIQKSVDLNEPTQLRHLLDQFHFQIQENRYIVNGEDLTEKIRSPEVTKRVSEVSALPAVRQTLVRVQQEFGAGKNALFEGRDMGTVVFPEAEVKIYLTARPAVRAERRYLELKNKNSKTTEEEVLKAILERDHCDSTREYSPLKQAEDAHVVDTSDLTLEKVIEIIMALIPS